jgi:hypothetical protein
MTLIPLLANHYKPLRADEELLVAVRFAAQQCQRRWRYIQMPGEHLRDRFVCFTVSWWSGRADLQLTVHDARNLIMFCAWMHSDGDNELFTYFANARRERCL